MVKVDEEVMVRVLDEMLSNAEGLREMGIRGPEFARSRYEVAEVARTFALAYEDVLSGNRSPACRWSDG